MTKEEALEQIDTKITCCEKGQAISTQIVNDFVKELDTKLRHYAHKAPTFAERAAYIKVRRELYTKKDA